MKITKSNLIKIIQEERAKLQKKAPLSERSRLKSRLRSIVRENLDEMMDETMDETMEETMEETMMNGDDIDTE